MAQQYTPEQIQAILNENAKLREIAASKSKLSVKIGEKGGLCVYGLQSRFPVTLYVEQWERLIEFVPTLQAFIQANEGSFKRGKDDARFGANQTAATLNPAAAAKIFTANGAK